MAFQVPGNLLQQISNPKVADIPGEILAGQKARADSAETKAKTILSQQKEKTGLLQQLVYDTTAMTVMDDNVLPTYFDTLKKKYASSPAIVQQLEALETMPKKERLTKIFETIQMGQTTGLLPAAPTAAEEGEQYKKMGDYIFDFKAKDFAKGPDGKRLLADQYEVVGNNIYDKLTSKFIKGPEADRVISPGQRIIRTNPDGTTTELFKADATVKDVRTDLQKHLDDLGLTGKIGTPEERAEQLKRRNAEIQRVLDTQVASGLTTVQKNAIGAGLKPGTEEFYNFVKDSYHPKFGTIPAGFKLEKNKLVALPGGNAALERNKAKILLDSSVRSMKFKTSRIQAQIAQAKKLASWHTTGIPGQVIGIARGTPAFNLKEVLDTLKANLGFDKLQAMRDISPTGGALGQVSERELAQLERAIASLNKGQSPKQLQANLDLISEYYKHRLDEGKTIAQSQAKALGVVIAESQSIDNLSDEAIRTYSLDDADAEAKRLIEKHGNK